MPYRVMQGTNKAIAECRLIKLNQRKDYIVLATFPTTHFLPLFTMGSQLDETPA